MPDPILLRPGVAPHERLCNVSEVGLGELIFTCPQLVQSGQLYWAAPCWRRIGVSISVRAYGARRQIRETGRDRVGIPFVAISTFSRA